MAKQTPSKSPKTPSPKPVAASHSPPPANSPAGGDEEGAPENALEELAAQLGPPRPGVVEAVLAGTTSEALVEEGNKIASSRIITDTSRIYWRVYAWTQTVDPALLRKVKGFSMPLLAAAVDRALRLKRMAAGRRDSEARESSTQQQAASVAAKVVSLCLGRFGASPT